MKKKKKGMKYVVPGIILLVAILIVVFASGIFSGTERSDSDTTEPAGFTPDGEEINVARDGTKYIVDPDDLIGGGPPKDGIPSIDNPEFVSVENANEWIRDDALVLALNYKDVKRVYPFQIMTWHEIVNDEVAGEAILITYCPLCGSGIAYERRIDFEGERIEVEFGTSGKLYNSNLVMYDRETDSYWTQIGGKAIIGDLVGQELRDIDIDTVTWGQWKSEHPDTEVLSINTGFTRDYTSDDGPYANYFANDFQLFPGIQNFDEDNKLANKEFVFGIEVNDVFKAYAKKTVEEEGVIEDNVGGVDIRVEQKSDGSVEITNLETGEEIPKEIDFWFAWFAFHPETELYGFA